MSINQFHDNLFALEIFNGGGGYIAVNDASKALRRNAKTKARETNPGNFTPHLSHTFAGFDMLPAAIKNGPIILSGSDIKSRGKALGTLLKYDYWINIHQRMHGHVIRIIDVEVACI